MYLTIRKKKVLQSLTAFTRTDAEGRFVFAKLPTGKAFSVLPMQPGFEFGRSQGVDDLEKDVSFKFNQAPHSIKLLSTRDFNILKKEGAFIVRYQDEFNMWYWIIAAMLFCRVYHSYPYPVKFSARYPQADQIISAPGHGTYRDLISHLVKPAGSV